MEASAGRVWVHIATTQEVVEVGLRTILETADAPFEITTRGAPDAEPDVVLFDVIHLRAGDTTDLEGWLSDTATTVIAIDRTLRPELGAQAREKGVEWGITLGIKAEELIQLITDAVTGSLEGSEIVQEWEAGSWLGLEAGLTRRESEIIGLVVSGLGNQEIADQLFLSINSIKSHIRSAYRKIGARSRAQAVAWGAGHGFPVDRPEESRRDDAVD
ncbi:LuxR C-terminal-related transcriptional regulator [Nocardioides dilutus]